MSKLGALGPVVVGGGTGFIGTHLCSLLRGHGYNVTVISRMPGPQRMTWHDLDRSGLPAGTTAVVNLAGQNVLDMKQRWTSGFKQNVYNSRVNTTTALVEAIKNAPKPPQIFITLSGVGVYRPHKSIEYDENSDNIVFDFLSKLCLEWEKAATQVDKITRRVTIRSGVVLGRNGGMIKQLYLPFMLGLGGPVATGDQFLPWIHITDLTRLILFSIDNQRISGIVNGVAPQCITNKEFTKAFASALNRPALIPVPQFILNMLLNEERANMLTQGQKVVSKKLKTFGFLYKYPDITSACSEIAKPTSCTT